MINDGGEPYDIFVSYAHVDNETEDEKSPGFVTRLCKYIKVAGRIKRGYPIRIFYDTDMASGTEFSTEIKLALKRTTLFVPILSASWQQSEWCKEELRTFSSRLDHRGDAGPRKPFFPILFENSVDKVKGYLSTLHIKHAFRFNMTESEFGDLADATTTELIDQLAFFEDQAKGRATSASS